MCPQKHFSRLSSEFLSQRLRWQLDVHPWWRHMFWFILCIFIRTTNKSEHLCHRYEQHNLSGALKRPKLVSGNLQQSLCISFLEFRHQLVSFFELVFKHYLFHINFNKYSSTYSFRSNLLWISSIFWPIEADPIWLSQLHSFPSVTSTSIFRAQNFYRKTKG